MKVPWPEAFKDGDAWTFLEEFEDVAEPARIRKNRDKLTVLQALLNGRSRTVLDPARRGPEKMEWAVEEDARIAGFYNLVDRQQALQSIRTTQLVVGVDPCRMPWSCEPY
ncbi:unnamed protein product [Echinostoma caproni]|uniref:Transposase n=1 Tax=Echinostoma caproni TaxID=27848 RepID=A0A183AED5_9TREM|nr:unnamed protein product [Echinostoma caproni]